MKYIVDIPRWDYSITTASIVPIGCIEKDADSVMKKYFEDNGWPSRSYNENMAIKEDALCVVITETGNYYPCFYNGINEDFDLTSYEFLICSGITKDDLNQLSEN